MDEAPEALQRFLAPFMEQLTEKNLGNAAQLMSEDDRTEFDRLLGLVIEPVRPFAHTPSDEGPATFSDVRKWPAGGMIPGRRPLAIRSKIKIKGWPIT